jgi:DNA-binding MarR family transcriptional regulator
MAGAKSSTARVADERPAAARGGRRAGAADPQRPHVSYLVGRLDRALRRRMNEALAPGGLSLSQYTVLSVLHARGELSNAQLANRAFITPQAMNEIVQTLEAQKLVTRRQDPSHGRIVQLTLTARGLETLRECDAAVTALEQSMLAPLSEAGRDALRTALNACIQTLEGRLETAK